jgi:hypothetical protein
LSSWVLGEGLEGASPSEEGLRSPLQCLGVGG